MAPGPVPPPDPSVQTTTVNRVWQLYRIRYGNCIILVQFLRRILRTPRTHLRKRPLCIGSGDRARPFDFIKKLSDFRGRRSDLIEFHRISSENIGFHRKTSNFMSTLVVIVMEWVVTVMFAIIC